MDIQDAVMRGVSCKTPQTKRQQRICDMFSLDAPSGTKHRPCFTPDPQDDARTPPPSKVAVSQVDEPPTAESEVDEPTTRYQVEKEPHARSQVEKPHPVPRSQVEEPPPAAASHVPPVSEVSPRTRTASRKGFPSDWDADDAHMYMVLFGSPDRQPQLPLLTDDTARVQNKTPHATKKDNQSQEPKPKSAAERRSATAPATPKTAPKRKATKLSGPPRGRKPVCKKADTKKKAVTFAGHRAPLNPTKRAVFMQIIDEYAKIRTTTPSLSNKDPTLPSDGHEGNQKAQPSTTFTQKKFMQQMKATIKSYIKTGLDAHVAFAKAAADYRKTQPAKVAPS